MSGPIIRKYGFPNFEKIFGERPLQHGADEPERDQPEGAGAAKTDATDSATAPNEKATGKKDHKPTPPASSL